MNMNSRVSSNDNDNHEAAVATDGAGAGMVAAGEQAQPTLFKEPRIAGRPPLPHRRSAALHHRDGSALNREQVAEAQAFLEEMLLQRPQAQYSPGKHRCETFPECDHAGCNVLKALQAGAKQMLDRWNAERRNPRQALADLRKSERELDRTLTELRRSRSAGRRAS